LESTKESLILEYTEANQNARQIDNRIWGIYGIYFGLLAAIVAVLFGRGVEPTTGRELVLMSGLILASLSQMALVGHLQSYSDRIYNRIRQIERKLGLRLHEIFEPPPGPSERLWGLHKWLSIYRARDVMQVWGFLVILAAFTRSGFLLLTGDSEMDPKNVLILTDTFMYTILGAVAFTCITVIITALIANRQLKRRIRVLEAELEESKQKPRD